MIIHLIPNPYLLCTILEGLLGVPARRDVRSPSGDPPILKLPAQTSQGSWLIEEDVIKGPLNNRGCVTAQESDMSKADKQRAYSSLIGHSTAPPVSSAQLPRGRVDEVFLGSS